jgi:polyhydroxybutyrate depolymerase
MAMIFASRNLPWRAAVIAAAAWLLAPNMVSAAPSPEAKLTGSISLKAGNIGGRERRYAIYVPRDLQPRSPLLIVLHGGGGDGPLVRQGTGFEFDMLADANSFVVIYPDGIGQGWNTCRKGTDNDATRRRIDDVGFIEAIIAHESAAHDIDKRRVFATGHSFGGQMAYRLALEHPNEFAGIAAISANLPAPDFNSCQPVNAAIPVMIMNGTDDPVSPYRGGRTGRGANQSNALSTEATARYFVTRNGLNDMPAVTRVPHRSDSDPTWVERVTWTGTGKAGVVLYTVHGGGHVVPQPYYRYPVISGRQTEDLDAPAAIWEFFSKLPPRTAEQRP